MADRQYLGDSVYITYDGSGNFVITTENGYGPSNQIFLEPNVVYQMLVFMKLNGVAFPSP